MRKRRAVLALVGLALSLSAPAPAVAGGGGHGGACPKADPDPESRMIDVTDSCFLPATMRVRTGEAVTWRLVGVAPHTVTSTKAGFDSGDLERFYTVRFNAPGRYPSVCVYHSGPEGGMVGTIVVEGQGLGGMAPATVLEPTPQGDDPRALLAGAEERLAEAIVRAGGWEPDPPVSGRSLLELALVLAVGAIALAMIRGRGAG